MRLPAVPWMTALAMMAVPVVAVAATSDLTARTGNWVRVFSRDVENAAGRSVNIDKGSIRVVGTARTFRELDVLVAAKGNLPRGTMQFMRRSVNCSAGTTRVEQWQLVAANGTPLTGSTTAGPAQRVRWDNEDGMVIRYVCSGVLPR